MRTGHGYTGYVVRMADRSGNDLCVQVVNAEQLGNFYDQLDAILGDIIQTAQERRYIGSSCTGSEQRLVHRED
ncbi:hypothetical protein D3C87_1793880 [compost metagenome]